MSVKFIGKNPLRKLVKRIPNNAFVHRVKGENNNKIVNDAMEERKLDKIEKIVGLEKPKKRIKVEKKEKGLVERTDVVVLTEDNKILLND